MNVEVEIDTDSERIRPINSEVERLWADTSKVRDLFKWQPTFVGREGFKRGLAETIEWFTDGDNLEQYKPGNYNV